MHHDSPRLRLRMAPNVAIVGMDALGFKARRPGYLGVEAARLFPWLDAGAVVYDGKRWHAVGTRHGLPSQTVTSILPWRDTLWIGTWGGLVEIDRGMVGSWLAR